MKTSLLTTLRLVIGFSVLGGYGCSPKDTLPGDEVWVFLLAGQSNMAGRDQAEEEDRETHPRVWTIDSLNNFKLAEQPLHFYEPDRPGVDCGLAFGTELVENLEEEVTILILPTAVGGTRIDQWLGDSTFRGVTLLSNFKEKAKLGRRHGKIKGILWHQGEDDAPFSDNIEVHDEQLGKLFDEFRSICRDRKLPIFVGELGSFSRVDSSWQAVNAQISKYADTDPYCEVIETSDLDHLGDFVHFDAPSQRILGRRFARKYLETAQD